MMFLFGILIIFGLKKNCYEGLILLIEYGSYIKEKKQSVETMSV